MALTSQIIAQAAKLSAINTGKRVTVIFDKFVTDQVALVVHLYLLSLSVLSAIVCVIGIRWEAKGPLNVHTVAARLVIGGVAIESLCTICLFVFDEGISASQQSKIIALETHFVPRYATPALRRRLNDGVLPLFPKDRPPAVGAVPATKDNADFAIEIASILGAPLNEGAAQIQVGPVKGVVAAYVTRNERGKRFAEAFAKALNDSGIEAAAVPGLMESLFRTPTPSGGKGLDPTEPGQSWVVIVVGERP